MTYFNAETTLVLDILLIVDGVGDQLYQAIMTHLE